MQRTKNCYSSEFSFPDLPFELSDMMVVFRAMYSV